jgi:hypothetical protein
MLCEELEYLGFKVNTEYGVDEKVLSRLLRDNGLVLRSEWAQVGFTCFFALNAYRSSVFLFFYMFLRCPQTQYGFFTPFYTFIKVCGRDDHHVTVSFHLRAQKH